jgi:hypothetical protein
MYYKPMSQLLKPIDQWTSDDLEQFVRERAEESLVLEFKRELKLSTNSEKKEAAKDVCALANTSGGWIIYGIDEDRAQDSAPVAKAVVPFNAGDSASQLESIILSAISPAPKVRIRRIDSGDGSCVVVRVDPSSTCVHQVVAYRDYRFYRRTDYAARPMAEPEVRDAFARLTDRFGHAEGRFSAIQDLAKRSVKRDFFQLAFISEHTRDVVDPGELVNSHKVLASMEPPWPSQLAPTAEGAVSQIGDTYWLFCGRDASFAMSCPLEDSQLSAQRVLRELFSLHGIAKQACDTFQVHSAWHVGFYFKSPNPIALWDNHRSRGGTALQADKFLVPLSHSELLGSPERAASQLMRRLYQGFGHRSCPLFDANNNLLPAIKTEMR